MELIDILKNDNADEIQSYLYDAELEFYSSDEDNKTIDLGFSITNYNTLMDVLGCNDSGNPIINETFGDEAFYKIITIYPTKTIGIYFARLEEFGAKDEDAMKCFIIITNDIEKQIKRIIEEYKKKSIIFERDNT